jgi:hypothetical protein
MKAAGWAARQYFSLLFLSGLRARPGVLSSPGQWLNHPAPGLCCFKDGLHRADWLHPVKYFLRRIHWADSHGDNYQAGNFLSINIAYSLLSPAEQVHFCVWCCPSMMFPLALAAAQGWARPATKRSWWLNLFRGNPDQALTVRRDLRLAQRTCMVRSRAATSSAPDPPARTDARSPSPTLPFSYPKWRAPGEWLQDQI